MNRSSRGSVATTTPPSTRFTVSRHGTTGIAPCGAAPPRSGGASSASSTRSKSVGGANGRAASWTTTVRAPAGTAARPAPNRLLARRATGDRLDRHVASRRDPEHAGRAAGIGQIAGGTTSTMPSTRSQSAAARTECSDHRPAAERDEGLRHGRAEPLPGARREDRSRPLRALEPRVSAHRSRAGRGRRAEAGRAARTRSPAPVAGGRTPAGRSRSAARSSPAPLRSARRTRRVLDDDHRTVVEVADGLSGVAARRGSAGRRCARRRRTGARRASASASIDRTGTSSALRHAARGSNRSSAARAPRSRASRTSCASTSSAAAARSGFVVDQDDVHGGSRRRATSRSRLRRPRAPARVVGGIRDASAARRRRSGSPAARRRRTPCGRAARSARPSARSCRARQAAAGGPRDPRLHPEQREQLVALRPADPVSDRRRRRSTRTRPWAGTPPAAGGTAGSTAARPARGPGSARSCRRGCPPPGIRRNSRSSADAADAVVRPNMPPTTYPIPEPTAMPEDQPRRRCRARCSMRSPSRRSRTAPP